MGGRVGPLVFRSGSVDSKPPRHHGLCPNAALVALVIVVASIPASCSKAPDQERSVGESGPAAPSAAQRSGPSEPGAASVSSILAPEAIALNNRGVGLMGFFEFEQAEETFGKAIDSGASSSEVEINRAIAVLNQSSEGRQEQALEILQAILEREPRSLRAAYAAGLCRLFLGDAPEALPLFGLVAKADPRDPYAAYYHGQCLELSGDVQQALAEYRRAAEIDPYLRSAFLGVQRCLQRLGQQTEAEEALETFMRLAENPRARLAEFKYTRMGRKGEALALPTTLDSPTPPNGPRFGPPAPLARLPDGWAWAAGSNARSVTVADIDGDGRLDVLIPGALLGAGGEVRNAVVLQGEDGSFGVDLEHPLATVPGVESALWGDIDNDGRIDVVLCGSQGSRLWKSTSQGWADATDQALVLAGVSARTGLLADLDHDGDLDILLVDGGPHDEPAGGRARMLINLDGTTFRDITDTAIPAGSRAIQAVAGDFDGDRDLDLFLLGAGGANILLRNDRLWSWAPWTLDGDPSSTVAVAAAAGDVTGDGAIDLVLLGPDGSTSAWTYPQRGEPVPVRRIDLAALPAGTGTFALADLAGTGVLEAVDPTTLGIADASLGWALPVLDARRGASILTLDSAGAPTLRSPGAGRFDSATIELRGRVDPGQSMRSNASGIGTLINARIGDRWVTRQSLPMTSTPGQPLQPIPIGLGGAPRIDFVFLDWSDGVFQSELDLGPGGPHRIVETQRQISSCPLLFAWDGQRHRFISDVLGVGGMGYLVAPGEYAPPRPWEYFLLPEGLPAERDGALEILLHEPMEEAVYLDFAALHTIDVPGGWTVVLDERMGLAEPMPTGEPIFIRDLRQPSRAVVSWSDQRVDCTEALALADGLAAPVGPLDSRHIGRLLDEHVLTLEFEQPLRGPQGATAVLIADGWVEYPYSQTNFAAWQAGAAFTAPSIEVQVPEDGSDQPRDPGAGRRSGAWVPLLEQFGYPAGMPRTMSVPLPPLPDGCTALRLRSNLEIHWDRMAIGFAEPCPEARRMTLPIRSAELRSSGFPRRSEGPSRRPIYDYEHRAPLADMKVQPGWYTRFGDVIDLVSRDDGALAIFGPGEEVRLRFAAPAPVAEGFHRHVVLEVRGWCKDMDLFTLDGERLEPLPGDRGEAAELLHRRHNTRFGGGR